MSGGIVILAGTTINPLASDLAFIIVVSFLALILAGVAALTALIWWLTDG